jgi:hypothetical protein
MLSEVHMLSWLPQAAIYLVTLSPGHLTGRQIMSTIHKDVVALQGSVRSNESSCIDLLSDVVLLWRAEVLRGEDDAALVHLKAIRTLVIQAGGLDAVLTHPSQRFFIATYAWLSAG